MKEFLYPVLPKYMEAFVEALHSANPAVTDTGIKTDVMKALTLIVRSVPTSQLSSHIAPIVNCVWSCLVSSYQVYFTRHVSGGEEDEDDDLVDSDGRFILYVYVEM